MDRAPFHPLIAQWLTDRLGPPTEAQAAGWPSIIAGQDTLIAAPTGSGKTLAAFLTAIDRLLRDALANRLTDTTRVLYVSPLKALSHDIERNLTMPLAEIMAAAGGPDRLTSIRTAVRTGDTSPAERQRMLRHPPHILITTPESLYLLLTAEKARTMLRDVETVIVDEIHAVARDKRGSHLALSLARLDALCATRPTRIGLSATQRPMDEVARFLIGSDRVDPDGRPQCAIVDVGHRRPLDLGVILPPSDLSAVCSNEQWEEIYGRIAGMIAAHRSTVVFVNTRRMAERVTLRLTERLGEASVLSHHGSLSKRIRHHTEQQLKAGAIKAVVATASLELGIDIGFIDLVVQIGSPRSIATLLQRVGRSGHALGRVPKGRLAPLTRDELLECAALLRALQQGTLDRIEPPEAPLDILAQQIVAETACREWSHEELWALCRRAWPYRDLSRLQFDAVLRMLSEGFAARFGRTAAYLHDDRIGGRVKARRGARLTALTSGGAIPELADYRVVAEPDGVVVGSVDEDFAVESLAGDVFLLGNTSWRVRHVRGGDVVVADAQGAPPSIPFWRGEAPARTRELSAALSDLRQETAARLRAPDEAVAWLMRECLLDDHAARQMVHYLAAQIGAVGMLPTHEHLLVERFFDESGGMQLVIHCPYGGRINKAWGLAMRKRFCRTFNFELQSSADDNGIVLSLGPQQSFPLETVPELVPVAQAEAVLVQALLAAPMFTTRWRWNANRALAIPRQQRGRKVPPPLQRMRSDDLLTAVFPQQTACRENMTEPDIPIPDHPLIRQTLHDCLHEAMDLAGWRDLLQRVADGRVRITTMDTREPSPFAYEILNAAPYAFLDDAPLEERRARAVATRRTLPIESLRDLGALDPAAIDRVRAEAWPLVRDADELYDALMLMGLLPAAEGAAWRTWFPDLVSAGRAKEVVLRDTMVVWVAVERGSMVRAAFPDAAFHGPAPPADPAWTPEHADVELVRGRLEVTGPATRDELARTIGLPPGRIDAALATLEFQGVVLRGRFRPHSNGAEWCARRLLARIHRLTLDRLRRDIEPVSLARFAECLFEWQHLTPASRLQGPEGVYTVLRQLQGLELPAVSWERNILPARVEGYQPRWLDEWCLGGEVAWGRIDSARRDAQRAFAPTRNMPIAFMLRENVHWLRRADPPPSLSARALLVVDALRTRGALFTPELIQAAHLVPSELDRALWEAVSAGLVTQDGFGPVRVLTASGAHRGRRHPRMAPRGHGRWTLWSDPLPDEALSQWAALLLDRYGVLFRELVHRERRAPPWHRLAPALRAMEVRGEVRGGRFVADVGGEQYALPSIVEQLRRPESERSEVVGISAVDPANINALFRHSPGVRHHPAYMVAFVHGRCAGIRQRQDEWVDPATLGDVRTAVQAALRGRRTPIDTVSTPRSP